MKLIKTQIALLVALIAMTIIGLSAVPASAQKAMKSLGDGDKQQTTKQYPPGSAWTLSWPLGTHVESTVDTLLYNYQRTFVTALTTDAWASTGQIAGPGIDMIYFNRTPESHFFFNDAITRWVPSFSKQKFYNMYIPFTQLIYNMGYGTENRTDLLRATFAGNVNKKLGFGATVDYPYTKGSYAQQATKELAFSFSAYYLGSRYEMQAFYNHYNHLNKESGGITDDRYITNPEELQGGQTSVEPLSIPVHLADAHNRVTGGEFYMSHAYKLGYWRDITQEEDTVKREEFVASTKFVYSFDWKENHHFFIDVPGGGEGNSFWKNTYFDPSRTEDDARYWSISNTLGVEMIEGFQKWAKFGLSVYATYELDRYKYSVLGLDEWRVSGQPEGSTPLPVGYEPLLKETRNRVWVGGRIEKTRGSIVKYAADAKFGLVGKAAGEIDARGEIQTRFRLGNDSVTIAANAWFKNLEPNYFYENYVGNHFQWRNDFGKIRNIRAEGKIVIPWSRSEIRVGVENVQNQIYMNSEGLPAQHGGSVQVFSASLHQPLRFGIWNWNNTVTYQTSSNRDVIPLPQVAIYSNMFLYFKAFKALTVQVGVDCNWYMKYRGYAYQPATMSFHTQGADGVDVGNFALANVYLTAKLYKVRLFLMCSHVNQGWPNDYYFTLPHYPVDPRQFRLGLSIDFTD